MGMTVAAGAEAAEMQREAETEKQKAKSQPKTEGGAEKAEREKEVTENQKAQSTRDRLRALDVNTTPLRSVLEEMTDTKAKMIFYITEAQLPDQSALVEDASNAFRLKPGAEKDQSHQSIGDRASLAVLEREQFVVFSSSDERALFPFLWPRKQGVVCEERTESLRHDLGKQFAETPRGGNKKEEKDSEHCVGYLAL
jgi:hypothetical protein